MKIFNVKNVAEGYSKDRPYFHPIVVKKIKEALSPDARFKNGLDVGCGAGLSTIALKEICEKVTGIDPAEEMITSAIQGEGIQYYVFPAEDIPLNEQFDIITLSGAIDWIDRPKFLKEAKRLLASDGKIVVYDNDFSGEMKDNFEFKKWHDNFLKEYPRPPRNSSPLDEAKLGGAGFRVSKEEKYSNEIEYDLQDFFRYLFTQSNVTAALKSVDRAALREKLTKELHPFFKDQKQLLIYGGYVWYVEQLQTK